VAPVGLPNTDVVVLVAPPPNTLVELFPNAPPPMTDGGPKDDGVDAAVEPKLFPVNAEGALMVGSDATTDLLCLAACSNAWLTLFRAFANICSAADIFSDSYLSWQRGRHNQFKI